MSTIAILIRNGFDSADFANKISTDILDPTTEIRHLKNKIVITGDDGRSVELYGEDLQPKKTEGHVTSGAFFIDGEKVAELSELNFDISSDEWFAALFASGYAPVRSVLGVSGVEGFQASELTILGGEGDDTISGGGKEKNFLFGGQGDDIFFGGEGENDFDGGEGRDHVDYAVSLGKKGVVASLADASQNAGAAKGDDFESIEDLTGSLNNDLLIGDAQSNKLNGFWGDDTLVGGAGKDTLDGGVEDKGSVDFASYAGARSTGSMTGVTVSLAGKATATGDAKGDVLKNIEGLIGSRFDDNLTGNGKANALHGGDGADTLVGGVGGDALAGGRGADVLRGDSEEDARSYADLFVFKSLKEAGDLILDFDTFDKIGIDLSGFGLSETFEIIRDETYFIGVAPKPTSVGPAFLIDMEGTTELWFDADGAGAGEAQLVAEIVLKSLFGVPEADDFILG